MPHVDMQKIEEQIAAATAALLPISKQDDSMGAQARMGIVVDTAFSRQLAIEINRGTSVEHVSDALAACCANMIASMAQSSVGSDDVALPELVQEVNAQILKTAHYLMLRFQGKTVEAYHGHVDLDEGGHA